MYKTDTNIIRIQQKQVFCAIHRNFMPHKCLATCKRTGYTLTYIVSLNLECTFRINMVNIVLYGKVHRAKETVNVDHRGGGAIALKLYIRVEA